MSVTVLVEFLAQPGKGDEVASGLQEKGWPTLDGVAGFQGIRMYRDRAEPDRIVEIEMWESHEAWETWVGPVLAELGPGLQPLLKEAPRMMSLDQAASRSPKS